MKINYQKYQSQLLVTPKGRLDATWSQHFHDDVLTHIRTGEHQILIDAKDLEYLSSIGIRALMMLYRELEKVQGSFQIGNAREDIASILSLSGFDEWLSETTINVEHCEASINASQQELQFEHFPSPEATTAKLTQVEDWQPWQRVAEHCGEKIVADRDVFSVGVGAAGTSLQLPREHLGEFLLAGGHAALNPPDAKKRPDCLITCGGYQPALHAITALGWKGMPSNCLRFNDPQGTGGASLSRLAQEAFDRAGDASALGMVLCGEIDGLVGVSLVKSPAFLGEEEQAMDYPQLKEWLLFCGERAYARELAVVVGVVTRSPDANSQLRPLTSNSQIFGHFHAAVFPHQLLSNGNIPASETLDKIFNGPPPRDVMHLLSDERPEGSLGESSLVSGACWFIDLQN